MSQAADRAEPEPVPRAGAQRREYILRLLHDAGEVNVGEVADALEVSEMTVRRDLARLDKEGMLRRVHGGATMKRGTFSSRAENQPTEKSRIARAAAGLVGPGESVGIDIGTTCHAVAVHLARRDDLFVVTNSVFAALEFRHSRSTALVLGGQITGEGSLVNGSQAGMRPDIHLDKLILGCGGVSATDGVSYFDLAETQVRHELREQSTTTILVADHTKLDHRRPVLLPGGLEIIDVLVTSGPPSRTMAKALDRADVELVVVEK